jgi:hypothetical protein
MATRFWLAQALAAVFVAPAFGQTLGLPGATPGAVGTGPQTDIQVSPNGTIDVGGSRGADVDLTGENLRGAFGAARIEPSPIAPPVLPAPSVGGSVSRLPNAVDFGAGLVPLDPSSPNNNGSHVRESRNASIRDLILPRFRSPAAAASEDWRYRYFRGRWWFWQPPGAWLFWNGSRWQPL